jgi:4-hydroxybenzoate polyprenyltransferase
MSKSRTLDTLPSTLVDQAPSPGQVVLERDLILSDLRLELGLLLLRDNPSVFLRFLTNGVTAIVDMPIQPRALRYDDAQVKRVRAAIANGETVEIASDLPASWRNAILSYLGLVNDGHGADYVSRAAPAMSRAKALVKALRLHQWVKNALVFLPLIMAHRWDDVAAVTASALAFLCFGLVASSIYLVNDMMDLHQDRRHESKFKRPFASGALPVSVGLGLLPILLGSAALIAAQLPRVFLAVMGCYIVLNVAYTVTLKRKLLVDVMSLAGSYILRILAGNAAAMLTVSNWLLLLALFVFFSLALLKRYVELDTVGEDQAQSKSVMGRGYRVQDLPIVAQMGVSSALAAVLVLALYIDSASATRLYRQPQLLWLICPAILYVLGRMWILASRRELPDDPVMFIVKDWRGHLVGAILVAIFFLAS